MNRENLKILADYLRGLPIGYTHFSMSTFLTHNEGGGYRDTHYPPDEQATYLNPCGSVACAVGHGPAAGIAPKGSETWVEYTKRTLIPDLRLACRDSILDEEELECSENASTEEWNALARWEWCFGSVWAWSDDTPVGAADRIEWMLENGVPPGWKEQQNGQAPLCYRKD